MIKTKDFSDQTPRTKTEKIPHLKIAKIGIVSRNYNHKFDNGFRDFSHEFSECCLDSTTNAAIRFCLPVQHRSSEII